MDKYIIIINNSNYAGHLGDQEAQDAPRRQQKLVATISEQIPKYEGHVVFNPHVFIYLIHISATVPSRHDSGVPPVLYRV